jgi:uncharacterized protein GlcG (DUF336 family)
MKKHLLLAFCSMGVVLAADNTNCKDVPTAAQLKAALQTPALEGVPDFLGGGPITYVGGLFNGQRMWAAVVNRDGEVCAFTTGTSDPTQVWPGSQAIAKAKAYTANAFSLDVLALSTARLYTFTQPGHSLNSLGASNLFDPSALAAPGNQGSGGQNKIAGGTIFFGGGVPIYKGGKIVGGLGISGDTACADHEVAKRVRHILGLNPPGGALVDDITYSGADGATVFTHPLCLYTKRNGVSLGTEANASGY